MKRNSFLSRALSILLAMIMVIGLVPVSAFATDHSGKVHVIVENTTYPAADGAPWEGTLVDTWVDIDSTSTMMGCVVAALEAGGYTQEGAENNYISSINGLAEFDGGSMSGWMGTLNDWFTNEGFSAFTVANGKLESGDEICIMYTAAYGEDLGGSWGNSDTTVKALTFSKGELSPAFDKDTHAYTLTVPAGTTSVVVTPTASNKNYQVRTRIAETVYKRTANVPVANGTQITVECNWKGSVSMNGSGDPQTYIITVAALSENNAPQLALGVNAAVEASVEAGTAYTLDLSAIFTDADDDELTYSVKVNDEAYVSTDAGYSYTPSEKGCTTLVFKANDGKIDSPTYTVTLTAAESDNTSLKIPVSIKTPTGVKMTFYKTTGFDENGYDIFDSTAPLSADYDVDTSTYKLAMASGTYSFRSEDAEGRSLGGMTFEITQDVDEITYTLAKLVFYSTKTYNDVYLAADAFNVDARDAHNHRAAMGEAYTDGTGRGCQPVLVYAGGNAELYNFKISPIGELTETYAEKMLVNQAILKDRVVTFNLPECVLRSIVAPEGARVQVFNQIRNFYVEEIEEYGKAQPVENGVKHIFRISDGSTAYTYRVSMDGKLTQAGYLNNDELTVSFDETDPKSIVNVMDNTNMKNRVESSTLLNVNGQNDKILAVGDTFRLRAYRAAWQIINTDVANIMIEPDFHYTVISGEEHISVIPVTDICTGNSSGNWLDIKGISAGTAIVEISYDAIKIGGTTYSGIYGATDPQRTSLVVIQVGGTDAKLSMTAAGSSNTWDTEYDTVYFTENTGSLTFNAAVDGQHCDRVELSTDKGSTWDTVSANGDTYTASGLVGGNNIFRFTAGDKTCYQVVRAAKVKVTVENQNYPDSTLSVGDTASVHITGLYTPVTKFSGIYNPGFGTGHELTYLLPEGVELLKSSGGQFDFINTHVYQIKVNTAGEIKLTGGYVDFSVMGTDSPFGAHRLLTDIGVGANFNAVSTHHTRSVLPDILIDVAQPVTTAVTLDTGDVIPANVVITDADGKEQTSKNGVYSLLKGTYDYAIEADGYISVRDSFTVSPADGEDKVITVKFRKADEATWDGKTKTEINPNVDGVYEISTGAQLAWFAEQVNSGIGAAWNARLTRDISLNNHEWMLIGNSAYAYNGIFDGSGHSITELFIKEGINSQGLFGRLDGTVQDLLVSGIVSCSGKQIGGIVGYLNKGTVQRCVSKVRVSGEQNVGGIAGFQFTSGRIIDCYSTGTIKCTKKLAGGISGGGTIRTLPVIIENSYAIGRITCPTDGGALTGSIQKSKIKNSYYLNGIYDGTSTTGTSKTAEELKTLADTLSDSFAKDIHGINNGYPVLSWQNANGTVNSIPVLISGINAAAEESLEAGSIYSLDLTKIFTDADNDALTYSVKVNDAEYVLVKSDYSYTASETGTAILVFKANDGKADSKDNYKVTLNVKRSVNLADIYQKTGQYLGSLGTPGVGSIGGEWIVVGLTRAGYSVPESWAEGYYANAIAYVNDHINADEQLHRVKSTDNSRLILALTAIGKDVSNIGGHNLLKGLTDLDYVKKQGINGPIWALIAFDSHGYDIPAAQSGKLQVTRDNLIDTILAAQKASGGWNLSDSATDSDTDMTAMAIQALAPYYDFNSKVKSAVDKALETLSGLQMGNGGYSSWGTTNSESCAQVIVALTSLGINPMMDVRFIKNDRKVIDALLDFAVEGGGFKHILNGNLDGMATEQAYYALASYYRLSGGKTALYDMSDVAIVNPLKDVEILIDAIGMVTLKSENVIKAARTAYDALTSSQKENISNYVVLKNAEEAYSKLKAKLDDVEKLIDAIGTVMYNGDCKSRIETARMAYNKLTAEEQVYVENYYRLTAAEEKYEKMKNAQKVIDLIDAIGEVTEKSKDSVSAARSAYNNLTKMEMAYVSNYTLLTAAERKLDALSQNENKEGNKEENKEDKQENEQENIQENKQENKQDNKQENNADNITSIIGTGDADIEINDVSNKDDKDDYDEGTTKVIGVGDTNVELDDVSYKTDKECADLMQQIEKLANTEVLDSQGIVDAYNTYLAMTDKCKAQVFNYDDLEALENKLGVENHQDEKNGFSVEGLEWYVRLVVESIESGDDYEAMSQSIGHNKLAEFWKIHFVNLLTGEDFIPDGEITVKAPAMKALEYDQIRIARYTESGTIAYVECKVENGNVVWTDTAFGYCALIGSSAEATEQLPEENQAITPVVKDVSSETETEHPLLWLYIAIACLGSAALVSVIVIRVKKGKNEVK